MYCMSPHHAAVKYKKTSDRSGTAHWCCTAQMELFCSKTQCQTILLHTSFKLRFNGHIITSPPMKLEQFQLNPFARSIYLHSHVIMWGFEWHSNSQGPGVPSEFVFGWQAKGGIVFGERRRAGPSPEAGASRRRWPRPCSSRWSRRKAAPSRYSASLARMRPEGERERGGRELKTQRHRLATNWSWSLKLQYVTVITWHRMDCRSGLCVHHS